MMACSLSALLWWRLEPLNWICQPPHLFRAILEFLTGLGITLFCLQSFGLDARGLLLALRVCHGFLY